MMLIEVNSSDIMTLADLILDTVAVIHYQGTDADGCKVYQIDCRPNVSYENAKCEAEEIVEKLVEQVKNAQKQPKPPKPDYKTEVFNLISSNPIPGVESIEVNESQRKFVIKYQRPTIGIDLAKEPDDVKTAYTLDKLEILWQAYQWQLAHDLPDFRFKDFVEFIKTPKEIFYTAGLIDHIVYNDKPVFHDRLMAEPKLTKE